MAPAVIYDIECYKKAPDVDRRFVSCSLICGANKITNCLHRFGARF